jgi:glycosyltransferase involved in cell wall biosynthesis
MNECLISIIIPTFNSENKIEVCLNSILNQSFKNYEVLIIDGLSKDLTLLEVKKFSGKISNLVVVSEKDKGIYDAMNKGINRAKGKWLYFMGSDDYFYSSDVLQQVSQLEELNTNEVIYGNVYSPVFNGVYDGEFNYSKLEDRNICHQGMFFKKSIFNKTGKFNLKYPILSDWHHNIKWFFSDKISNQHVDLIITNYGDSGISSLQEDIAFQKDKPYLLFKYGFRKLPYSKLIVYLNLIIDKEEINIKISCFKIIRLILRQLRRYKIYLYKNNGI